MKNNLILIDFTGCKYLSEIHFILKEKFGLPEYYGENWDALWDCLRYLWMGGENIFIEIYGFNTFNKQLKEGCMPMLGVFDDLHSQSPNVHFKIIS